MIQLDGSLLRQVENIFINIENMEIRAIGLGLLSRRLEGENRNRVIKEGLRAALLVDDDIFVNVGKNDLESF